MDKSGQREESPYTVWILGLVVFIALCWIGSCIISKDAGPIEKDVEVQPEATKLKPASVPDWHKAKSREEVVRRIKARLVSELAAYGLDASPDTARRLIALGRKDAEKQLRESGLIK